jgi:hypothetical protein
VQLRSNQPRHPTSRQLHTRCSCAIFQEDPQYTSRYPCTVLPSTFSKSLRTTAYHQLAAKATMPCLTNSIPPYAEPPSQHQRAVLDRGQTNQACHARNITGNITVITCVYLAGPPCTSSCAQTQRECRKLVPSHRPQVTHQTVLTAHHPPP